MTAKNMLLLVVVVALVLAGLWYTTIYKSPSVGIDNLITIDSVREQQSISSPLTITGKARGSWFFEASFPIVLTDGDGLIIAETHGQATGEWMTNDFVPFEAVLEFTKPENAKAFGNRGTLIIKNDNPSGDASRDKAVEIPIIFR